MMLCATFLQPNNIRIQDRLSVLAETRLLLYNGFVKVLICKGFSPIWIGWSVIAAMERLINLDSFQVRSMLPILLQDRTTNRNIIWATDTYAAYGEEYSAKESISASLVTGKYSSIIQPRISKKISDQADRTKKHAEVFTPAWICNRMINHCDEVWFGRKDVFNTGDGKNWTAVEAPIAFPKGKRWQSYVDSRRLEITCGEAPYLVSRYDAATGEVIPFCNRIGILDRKLRIVHENAADEAEWWKYAYRALESVYGYEYQGDNLMIARINVWLTFMDAVQEKWQRKANEKELRKAAEIISWNLWQMDGLKGTVPFGSLQESNRQMTMWELLGETMQGGENERPLCKIYDWRGQGKLNYNDRITRKGKEMKFDFVIGNPPYQEEVANNGRKNPVYNLFMDASYKVAEVVELITPARFLFDAGQTPKAWNRKMLNDEHFKVIHYESDASKIFPSSIEIKGGVAITIRNAKENFGAIDTFTEYAELNSIIRKTEHIKGNALQLSSIVASQGLFRFSNDFFAANADAAVAIGAGTGNKVVSSVIEKLPNIFLNEVRERDGYVRFLGRIKNKRDYRFIKREYLIENEFIDRYKLFIPEANNSGRYGEILTESTVGYPKEGAADTFLCAGPFDTENEPRNLAKYMKTKFFRALLGVKKVTQHCPPAVWAMIPLQDFTPSSDIDWSASIAEIDRQLYRKYNLSEEEIDFIETHVKEMQ